MKFLSAFGLVTLLVAQPATASPIVIDFEDQPDVMGVGPFPLSYQGVTWTAGHWLQYAPYQPNGYDPDGVNAIYAADVSGGPDSFSSFTFPDRVFVGASFSAPLISDPRFTSRLFFELYDDGTLVHTSVDLGSGALTFLPSGYGGLVDEVRVVTLRNGGLIGSLMTPGGSAWIMDNVTFDSPVATEVPEPASLWLLGGGIAGTIARRRRSRVK